MRVEKIIHAIDTHTGGETTRVVIHGFPLLPRKDPLALRELLATEHDSLRRMLMWEPRGHLNMFGALLLPPSRPDTDLATVFMHSGGYVPMCIHGLIGLVAAAVECGFVSNGAPSSTLKIETPAGITQVRHRRKPDASLEVTVQNVPAFVLERDFEVAVGSQRVLADIVFGGGIFALVRAEDLGLRVTPEHELQLQQAGLAIRQAINEKKQFSHPERPQIAGIELVEISDQPEDPRANARNVVVFGRGQLDRSPCGTGTCAKMALLHSRGDLPLGHEFVHESILGSLFNGRLVSEQCVGPYLGAIPEVTGSAFITGIQQFVSDPLDPFREGFLLGADSDSVASWEPFSARSR